MCLSETNYRLSIHNSHFGFFNDSACPSKGILNFIGSVYLSFCTLSLKITVLLFCTVWVTLYGGTTKSKIGICFLKLRYNWYITLYQFQVYVMIWHIYIYIYIYCKTITTISQVNIPHDTKYFFLVKITFKMDFLSNSLIYNIINYSHHAVHYIPRTCLFYNWKFVPFDYL